MDIKKVWEKFWSFLNEDTWQSFAVTLVLAFVVIKYIFFPGLSFLTETSLPLVIAESCSMHHYEYGFEKIMETSSIYEEHELEPENTASWDFQNGFNKGDVIFVVGTDDVDVGDVIIFNGGARYPLIHRIIRADGTYSTKGDNYKTNSLQLPVEKDISEEQLIGKALFRIPAIGWAKLIFFEAGRSPRDRGFCE